jgi:hypothetical protein
VFLADDLIERLRPPLAREDEVAHRASSGVGA